MEEMKDTLLPEQRVQDGAFEMKYGQTTYKVRIFFDHDGQMTAEEKLKRVIREEALKTSE